MGFNSGFKGLRSLLSEEVVSNKEFRAELVKLTAALHVNWAYFCPQTFTWRQKNRNICRKVLLCFRWFRSGMELRGSYCLFTRPFACIRVAPTGRIFMKFHIWGILLKLSYSLRFLLKSPKITHTHTHFTLRRTKVYDLTQLTFCELRW